MKKHHSYEGNPKGLPQRRSIRLKGYDYSRAGLYFITICCHGRICRFGNIENGKMILNEYGQIACNEWMQLQKRFMNFALDVFQIMPNHMHGIILLTEPVGAILAVASTGFVAPKQAGASPAPTAIVGDIVGAYKSLVANGCLEIFKHNHLSIGGNPANIPMMGKLWQRNYYEHIIRDERSYHRIAEYIINNPVNWKGDKFFRK